MASSFAVSLIASPPRLHFEQLPVEREIGDLEDLRLRSELVRAPDQGLDAREQLVEIERFGEIVVGADAQAP